MKDTLKKLSEDVAKELKAKFATEQFAEFVIKAKAAGDDRTFEVVMSTSDEDRQGDALDQSGWDFKYFIMNPVVLWAHDYSGFPIGIVTDIRTEGEKTITTGKFAPEGLNPIADIACALYQQGILKAVSPGYIQNDDGTRELLEQSFCAVPAGRHALSLRQVQTLGLSTPELITKGFFYKETTTKTEEVGDPCEGEDGTPGVLAKDPKNPGKLICVPTESKSQMNDLEKNLKAEHERHGKAVVKAIDEFEKSLPEKKAEGSDNSEMEKAIDEFETKLDDEHTEHLEKCMKAIDDEADKIDPEEKSIDEFKKAIEDEHLTHVKCFDKAIEEFKGADEPKKAIEEFRTKAEDELTRHEKAHMEMCKAEFGEGQDDGKSKKVGKKGAVAETLEESAEWRMKNLRMGYISTVIYAFCDAYYGSPVEAFAELIGEAISIIEAYVAEEAKDDEDYDAKNVKALLADSIKKVEKSGRTISAKTKAKIEAVIKSIEEFHAGHTSEHEEFTNKAIAALKAITPQGDEGKEGEEKSHTPNARSSSSRAALNNDAPISDLEAYLFTQRLLRQAKSALDEGLRQSKEKLKEKFPSRR